MSSGQRILQFNSRERLISTDLDRAQAFAACSRAQVLRALFNDKYSNWYEFPGVSTPHADGEAPLSADVFGGLMVQPGITSLLVQPGVVGIMFQDANYVAGDDSPYMLIDDPGLQTTGVLTFAVNLVGGTRFDIVECQPVEVVVATDNRDIFNPSTGLFTPTPIPKVKTYQLQYRIRQGVASAGMTAPVAGWLPLAVVSVTVGPTDFTGCDIWDVRPLIQDRVRSQPSSSADIVGGVAAPGQAGLHPIVGSEIQVQRLSAGTGAAIATGYSVNDFNGYLAGGALCKSSQTLSAGFGVATYTPTAGDAPFINLDSTENQSSAFSHTPDHYNMLLACFPAYLPRWVRYSESVIGSARIPHGPRGVVVVAPGRNLANGAYGEVTLPSFGSGVPAVVLGMVKSQPMASLFDNLAQVGGWAMTNDPAAVAGTITGGAATFSFSRTVNGVDPSPAKQIRCLFEMHLGSTAANPGAVVFELIDTSGLTICQLGTLYYTGVVGGTVRTFLLDVPLTGRFRFDEQNPVGVYIRASCTDVPTSGTKMYVLGWKLGDR